MRRNRNIEFGVLALGLLKLCYGQSPTATPETFPEERGLITTCYWYYDQTSQIRHFPEYPGYEDVVGELDNEGILNADVPVFQFANPNTLMLSLGVDYRLKSVYMYDYGLSAITLGTGYNKDLNNNYMEMHGLHTAVSKTVGIKLAVDWLAHNVYWSDPGFRWIAVAPGQIDNIDKGFFKIVVRSHLEEPNGLALDPIEGKLFWSDSGDHPKIECSDLMGEKRHTVVTSYLKHPTGLATDVYGKRLYWLDDFTDSVISVKYNGEDTKTIVKTSRSNFYEMDVFRDLLYITETYDGYIYVMNKTNGKEVLNPLSVYPHNALGIAVYGDENQPLKETDYCLAKNCDHFCITEQYGARCVCSEGFVLDERTSKCQEYAAGYHKGIVIANATHVCLVDIRAFVEASFLPRCIFTIFKQKSGPSTSSPGRNRRQVSSSPMATNNSSVTPNAASTTMIPTTTKTTMAATTPVVPSGDYIKKFDMDMGNRILFFATADNSIYKRPLDLPIENDAKELIVVASGNISGIAYDAEDPNNLYWCESDSGHVWVINTAGRSSKKVTSDSSELKNARDIIVLLNQRKLAMIAGSSPDISIQTMTMDGQDYNALVSGRREINAFTYDSEKQLLYYISSRRMYSVSLDGSESDTEFFGVAAEVISLVLYQNYLTWVYQNGTDLTFRTRDSLGAILMEPLAFNNRTLVDMKILDTQLQTPDHISPCVKDNGGCTQICVTKYENNVMTPVCECRLGYKLENGVNCTTSFVEDDFILVTDWTYEEILQISLTTNEINVVPASDSALYSGVYFDQENSKVIFSERFERQIFSINLNGTDRKVLIDIGYGGYPYRFDIDRTTGNLYFTAYYSSLIGVVTPSGEYTVLNDEFGWDLVFDIVLHPRMGWMYYTVYGWDGSYIGRSNMDGTDAVKLIIIRDAGYPDGLAIDYINDHLFWSDAEHDIIQQCNLNALDCLTIVNLTGTGQAEEIRDLVTDGVYLYYSTYRKDYVVRVELIKPYNREVVGQNYGLGKLDTMAFYSSKDTNIQPLFDGCRARNGLGDCSTICLPSSMGRTCACESGVSIKADGRTCSNIYQCTDIMYQNVTLKSGKIETIDVTMDMNCRRYLDDKCEYSCPVNFKPNFDTLLTCTKVGWNFEPNTLCKEISCPLLIENGKLAATCTGEIATQCDYTCDAGFVKTRDMAVCTKNGSFHISTSEYCAPYRCTDKFDNGSMDPKCPRTIGTSCRYTCDKFYTPSIETSLVTCEATGWSPTSSDLCKESVCGDNSLENGKVANDCQKNVGDACMFQCNQGYVQTASMVFCKSDKIWHPTDSCTPYTCSDTIENGVLDGGCARTIGSSCGYTCNKYHTPTVTTMQATCEASGWSPSSTELCEYVRCPSAIPNGEITGVCDLTVGTTCNFTCNDGFSASELHPNIACNHYGKWFTDELCLVPPTEKFKLSEPGVVSGFIILAALVIVLVVVVVYLTRRKRMASNYASFHNNHRGGISMENPIFGQEAGSIQ